ncbi:MAG: Hpt domain-containing protein [Phascolarctobacterium sp.]|nr:Hpt domain-containing protein [Phascolarctobacterium sp.]
MMKIWDLEKITGADIATTLEERFMGSEELYVRFLKKLMYDESYMQLKDAAQYGDIKGVEMKAHTLKGVCATLGLTELSDKFSHIVEMVRHGEIDEVKLRACVEDAGNKLRHVLLLIQDL